MKLMKKIFFLLGLLLWGYAMPQVHASEYSESVTYDNMSIGAGGSFYEPLINPADNNNYIVFSDMNDMYWSLDCGDHWQRVETKTSFFTACFSDDGSTLYAGSSGLYASYDKGQNMELIYPHPDTVKISVSRLGRNDDNILADGYDNGYVVCMDTYEDRVYFITLDWSDKHAFRLLGCNSDGSGLKKYYGIDNTGTISPLEVNYEMIVEENGIYYSDSKSLYFYDFDTMIVSVIYNAQGEIKDFEKINNYYFLLDDTDDATNILYTEDFITYQDLSSYNTLSSNFEKYGSSHSFEWHFKFISGNNFNSIFLAFTSEVDCSKQLGSNLGGVLKFDGTQFEWVYDTIFQTRKNYTDRGWNFGSYDPIYGICADPNDNEHCLMTNIDTVYDIYYGNNIQNVKSLHCTVETIDGNDYYSSTGLDCQATYFVREDPFDNQHLIICSADMGMQISYDGGNSFRRMVRETDNWSIYNTCYDVYFSETTQDLVYGLWSSRHGAPNIVPVLTDSNAKGGFAVSYDGGINWDFSYSSGLPSNSIPVKMCVVPKGNELTIAVATFNNGFYISYDSGHTFESISEDMIFYEGMIWGEDVVLVDDEVYCLTAYNTFEELMPSVLYKYNLITGETTQIDLGDIVIARSLTYDERFGLYINVVPYYYYGWIEEIQANYYVNYGGGVYHYDGENLNNVLVVENGVFNSVFLSDGTMYVTAEKGIVYVKQPGEDTFQVYVKGLFKRLENISFSRDELTLYVTTCGGGTYRMPTLQATIEVPEYTVNFVDWDNTIISTQTVSQGNDAILPDNPTRSADKEGTYTFQGWDTDTTNIQSDLTIKALYTLEAHTGELQNVKEATCTETGYTGDFCCTKCGMLLEPGSTIDAVGHTVGMCTENGDGTHSIYCAICDELMNAEDCVDADSDNYCDKCNYDICTMLKYSVAQSLVDGKKYLISSSGTILIKDLKTSAVTLEYDGQYYQVQKKQLVDMIWTCEDGYLYMVCDGTRYYLTVKCTSYFSYAVSITTDLSEALQWSYKNGSLSTRYVYQGRTINFYLYILRNTSDVSLSRRRNIVLYELIEN